VIGKHIRLGERSATIVGVLDPRFRIPPKRKYRQRGHQPASSFRDDGHRPVHRMTELSAASLRRYAGVANAECAPSTLR